MLSHMPDIVWLPALQKNTEPDFQPDAGFRHFFIVFVFRRGIYLPESSLHVERNLRVEENRHAQFTAEAGELCLPMTN